jgi:hypothetical protein
MGDRDGNQFYIGIYRFPADPQRERTILLEDIHPVVYQIAYPYALDSKQEPSLVHWSQISPEQGEGPWNAYRAAGRKGDIVDIESLYADLVRLHGELDPREQNREKDSLRRKVLAVEAHAEAMGYPLPDSSAPKP